MSGGFGAAAIPDGAVAVVFVARRAAADPIGYDAAAAAMDEAARRFPGYLGLHSARGVDGIGITVSYWQSDAAARAWKADAAHSAVRERGRAQWYDWYELVVAEVTRSYAWQRET